MLRKSPCRNLALLACLAPGLAGCGQMGLANPFQMGGRPLTVEPGDTCGPYRQELSNAGDYFTADVLRSTLIGAGGGALAGGLLAYAVGGNVTTGALVGLVGGAATGYFAALEQHNPNPASMLRVFGSDLSTESSQMTRISETFSDLQACRFRQASLIREEVVRGEISRAQGQQQLDHQHQLFDQEIAKAQALGLNMQHRDEQFANAAYQLRTRTPPSSSPPQVDRQVNRVVTTATESIPEKRRSFQNNVEEAQATSKVAFNVDTSSQTLLRRSWSYG